MIIIIISFSFHIALSKLLHHLSRRYESLEKHHLRVLFVYKLSVKTVEFRIFHFLPIIASRRKQKNFHNY